MALGARTGRPWAMGFGGGGGKQRPSCGKVGVGHAERRLSTWVGDLSRGAASDVPGSIGKPEPAFQSAESALPVQNRPNPGRLPFWPPRGARRNLGVRFRLIRAVSTRRAGQSCIDPPFWAEPCWRLKDDRARSNAKGAPAGSGPHCRGAVPADPDVLWCWARAIEATRPPQQCVGD